MATDSCGVMDMLWGLSADVHASWSAVFGPGLQGLQATPAPTLRPGLGGSPSDPRHAATLASRPSSRAMGRRRQAWPCLAERSYLYNNSNNLH